MILAVPVGTEFPFHAPVATTPHHHDLARERRAAAQDDMVGLMRRLADGLERLMRDHLALARLELGEDARILGREVATGATFLPFAFTAWLFVSATGAALLALVLPWAAALGVVAGLNALLAGAVLLAVRARRRRKHDVLDDSGREIKRTAELLATGGDPADLEKMHVRH